MLPFSSDGQAQRVQQDFSITEDAWNVRRELIMIRADHRAETARTELAQSWKQRLISKGGRAAAAPAAGAAVAAAAEELPFEDEVTKTHRSERDLGRLGLPARTGPEARLLGAGGTSLPSGSRFCRHHCGGGVAVDD